MKRHPDKKKNPPLASKGGLCSTFRYPRSRYLHPEQIGPAVREYFCVYLKCSPTFSRRHTFRPIIEPILSFSDNFGAFYQKFFLLVKLYYFYQQYRCSPLIYWRARPDSKGRPTDSKTASELPNLLNIKKALVILKHIILDFF
jgi:hypothetical protein